MAADARGTWTLPILPLQTAQLRHLQVCGGSPGTLKNCRTPRVVAPAGGRLVVEDPSGSLCQGFPSAGARTLGSRQFFAAYGLQQQMAETQQRRGLEADEGDAYPPRFRFAAASACRFMSRSNQWTGGASSIEEIADGRNNECRIRMRSSSVTSERPRS